MALARKLPVTPSLLLLALLLTSAWTAPAQPAFNDAAFSSWLIRFKSAGLGDARDALHSEGETLLTARAEVLRAPLHTDEAPREGPLLGALDTAHTLDAASRALLSAEFPALPLELWVDGLLALRAYRAMPRRGSGGSSCTRALFGTLTTSDGVDLPVSRIVTSARFSAQLASAVGLPAHGYMLGSVLVLHPAPAACVPAGAAQYRCAVGNVSGGLYAHPATAVLEGEKRRRSAMTAGHPSATPQSAGPHAHTHGGGGGGRHLDKVDASYSTGTQTMLAIRAVFLGQAASANDLSTPDFIAAINGLAAYHTRNSYGAVTFVPTIVSDCIYVMNMSMVADPAVTNADTIYASLLGSVQYAVATASGSTGTCVSRNPTAYAHFVTFIPPLAFLPWAGIATIPGRMTLINGDQGDINIPTVGHETGHTMGLMHSNVFDPRVSASNSNAEYGDFSDTMGIAARSTFITADGGSVNPAEFNIGYKSALDWLPDASLFNADPAGLNSTAATLLIQGSDRGTITTASGAYLGVSTPTPDGWGDRSLYIGEEATEDCAHCGGNGTYFMAR